MICVSGRARAARQRAAVGHEPCSSALEAALSLALLVGAALLIRSFYALQLTNPGFEVAQVMTTRLSVPQARYPAGPAWPRSTIASSNE